MKDWVRWVKRRLAAYEYELLDPYERNDRSFVIVARRTRFEMTKFGFCERFFIFEVFESVNERRMVRFCTDAFDCAIRQKKVSLACGFFNFVCCNAVAVTPNADRDTIDAVREDQPPKHWASVEIPVIWNPERGRLAYYEKTPICGAAYWAGFRREIEDVLREDRRD
jgi:hypothetical protein